MAAAELKLQVGLDLAFFRQQLAQLASASVGYSLPINIDRLAIQKEITKLGRNISSRKYTLKIDTTVKSAASDISNLQKALEGLEKKSVNVQITGTGNLNPKEARKIRAALGRSVLSNGGKIKIPTTIQDAITKDDITAFKNAVKSKLAGISVDVKVKGQGRSFAETEHGYAGVMQYMQKEGLIGKTASGMTGQMGKNGDDIKQQLGDAVKSAEKIKSIFDGVAKSIATTGKSIANVQGKRLGLTNVPLMAGGIERRVNRSAAAIGGTISADDLKILYPEVSRTIASFAALRGQIQQNTSKLSGFSLILGLAAFAGVPLAKSVVKLTGSADNFAKLLDELGLKLDAAFTKAASSILSAASGRLLSGGNVAGLLPAAYRGIGPSAGPAGLLPPAYRGLPPAYRGIGPSAEPIGLLPRTTRAGAMGDMMRMLSQDAGEESPGVLAKTTKARIDEIINKYLRVVEVQVGKAFDIPFELKKQLNTFSYLVQALRDAETRTGQMQMPATKAIRGTAFGSQKYLPTALSDETKKVLRDAAYAFLRVMREEMRKVVYQVNVRDLGQAISRQAMLPGSNVAGYLPPVGGAGRTAASYSYAYRAARPTSAMVPYAAGGALVAGSGAPPAPPNPPTPPSGGRGGFGSFGGFGGAMPNVSLPGAGLVKEVGDQFGYAAQQVLLFGTTYKALAFLTDFPSKVGEAVAQLQTFRNTLQAITPNADEFQKSNQFILDTVNKYNTPLQSARDGFTNLYASMAPAGFKGDEIRNIFAGISQGAATFGMSADKVDRVNYAFAQMASKGQVMSEELKGQLGDVLPGAVAIFAKAAGFTGPNAMVDFTKAMEAGRYKGEAMKQLLINVGIVMKDKFAKGAEGAAQNFQGQMNAMANATKNLYEAFEPAGNLFASKIIAPFTKGLTVITDGFKAYFDGQRAVNPEAEKLNKILETLVPSLQGIAQNVLFAVKQLAPFAQVAGFVVLQISRLLALPFVRYLAATYLQVLLLTTAFNALATAGVTAAIASLAQFTKGMILHAGVAMGLTKVTQQSTFAMYQFGTAVQTVMIKSVIGIALVAIGALIARIVDLKGQLASIGNDARGMEELAKSSAKMGDVQGTKEAFGNIEDRLQTIKELKGELSKAERMESGMASSSLNAVAKKIFKLPMKDDTAKKLIELGYISKKFLTKTADGYTILEHNLEEVNAKIAAGEEAFSSATQKKNILIDQSIRKNKELKKSVLGAIPDPADDAKKANLESYYSLLDDLAKATTQAEVDRAEAAFNHKRDLINAEYDYREARANSFQAKAIAFQKEIFNIVSKQEEEAFRDQNKIKLAAGSVSGLSPAGGGPTGGGPTGLTSYITGDPSQKGKGYQADHGTVKKYHDHLAFATRELAIEAYNKLTAADIKVTEFKGYGKGVTGPHSGAGSLHHQGLAMDVPGYQWGGTGAIGAKEYAGSARVRQVMGIGGQASAGAPRNVPGSEKREEVSQRKTNLLTSEARAAAIEKEARTTEELRVATERYIASLLPTAEQGLQNQLLEQKINLTRAGASPSILEAQLTYARQELEVNETIRVNTLEIEKLTAAGGKNSKVVQTLTALNIGLKASLPVSAIQLLNKAISEQTLALVERTRAAKRDAEDQSRINDLIIGGMTRQAAEAKIAADNLRKDYKKALEEATKQVDIAAAAFEVLAAAKRLDGTLTKEQTAEYNRLAEALKRAKEERDKLKGEAPKIEGGAQEAEKVSTPIFGDKIKAGMATAQEELTNLTNAENILVKSANNIGNAFGAAFGQIIDGSMSVQDALGSMFKQIGQDFINMAMEIIAKQMTMIVLGFLMKALGLIGGIQSAGNAAGTAAFSPANAPGLNAIPGQAFSLPKLAANGATFSNGIAKFATGGIVNGPTLFPFADGGAMQMGLMGEAGPEAIMPLQRGADGSLGVRAAMGGNGMGGSSSPILNMNFETSTINGVEYVSRDQLEAAMAQTRRQASSDGAKRGMAMTLDKIQQSPQTRRRIGM